MTLHHLGVTFHISITSFRVGVSNPAADGPGTYQVSFYHDNQIARWYDDSLSWCQESVALSSGESAAQLVSQLDDSFYVDRKEPIRISGQVVFQDLQVSESLRAPQVRFSLHFVTSLHISIIIKAALCEMTKFEDSQRMVWNILPSFSTCSLFIFLIW